MFTTRRLNIIAATVAAGTLGTVGIVAAGDTGSTDAPTAPATAEAAPVDTAHEPPTEPTTPADADTGVGGDTTADTNTATDQSATDGTTAEPTTPLPSIPTPVPATIPPSDDTTEQADTTPAEQPTEEPAEPTEPADQPDEEAAPGTPGVIEGTDVVDTPPPSPTPAPPTMLTPVEKPAMTPVPEQPIDLLAPPTDPDPEPNPGIQFGPGVFKAVPVSPNLGTITNGHPGCDDECIVSATLTPQQFSADMNFSIKTAVPASIQINIKKVGEPGFPDYVKSDGYSTEWNHVFTGLEANSEYQLLVVATGGGGQQSVWTNFWTKDLANDFASQQQGCAAQCITLGSVSHTDDYDTVNVQVETNTGAELKVWVSPDAPEWVDGVPVMPESAVVYDTPIASTAWSFDVDDLNPNSQYHVVARAEDAHGADYRTGTFNTAEVPPALVRVAFERIDVLYDGDHGKHNRGELAFNWGFDGTSIGTRSEEKIDSGETIHLSGNNYEWFEVDRDGQWLPNIMLEGIERDRDVFAEFCSDGGGVNNAPTYNAGCDTKTNIAQSGLGLSVANVEALPLCTAFGYNDERAEHRCMLIGTPAADDDYAQFNVIVSFDVL